MAIGDDVGDDEGPTVFVKLPDPTSGAFTEPDVRSHMKKWDLGANSQVLRFRYTKPFHKMDPEPFLRDFFNSPAVREHFQVVDAKGRWRGIGETAAAPGAAVSGGRSDGDAADDNNHAGVSRLSSKCVRVKHELVPCSAISMAFFDKIYAADEPPIVREGTEFINKCLDDVVEGFPVADALREFLLREESDNYELYSPEERSEFLFRLLQHCCLGGSMCQFEDHLDTYLDVAKRLYKALVAARKDKSVGPDEPERAAIASDVYAVRDVELDGGASAGEWTMYPKANNRQNFCYLCVDPWKRHVTVWYHGYRPFW